MAINRIKFNDSASDSGAFTLILNPSQLELNDDNLSSISTPLDGGRVIQNAFFDHRPLRLKWSRIPNDFTGFTSMLTTLRSYQGLLKYVHFKTADYRISGTGWFQYRVADVKTSIVKGGKVRYNVEVILFPVQ